MNYKHQVFITHIDLQSLVMQIEFLHCLMDHLPYSSMYICIPGVCNDLQFILKLEKALKQNVHVLLLKQRLYKYKQVSFRKL